MRGPTARHRCIRSNRRSPRSVVRYHFDFAIVDEVDSILIDEARTPLIISGQAEDHTQLYVAINAVAPQLKRQIGELDPRTGEGVIEPGDFTVDEKSHQIYLTEDGHENAERLLSQAGLLAEGASLYDAANITLMHHLYASLRAHHVYHRDQHYVVQNGEVIIVDEFTGRLMTGRRWSDGLHQAVEAKEGVQIQAENQTLASITFQNYFRMYGKLSGMTGTADTEAYEFQEIYGLETVVIPPNRILARKDQLDLVYKTAQEKFNAIVADIRDCHERGQPVLVGTTSIENSELLSNLLNQGKLPHQVLNAKQHEREAAIIAEAGRPKAITIATNMAGRGTDIVLGGNVEKQAGFVMADASLSDEEKAARVKQLQDEWQSLHEQVKAAGGLHIIGTERHEARRIDLQLRGRCGRQGDPGSSRFFLSLEDDLMRIFAGEWVKNVLTRLGMQDGEAIESRMVTRRVEAAQKKVEERNFDVRKNLLEYDEVMDEQRKRVYGFRQKILDGDVAENYEAEVLVPFKEALAQQIGRALQFFYSGTTFNRDLKFTAAGSIDINNAIYQGNDTTVPGATVVTTLTIKANQDVSMNNGNVNVTRKNPTYNAGSGIGDVVFRGNHEVSNLGGMTVEGVNIKVLGGSLGSANQSTVGELVKSAGTINFNATFTPSSPPASPGPRAISSGNLRHCTSRSCSPHNLPRSASPMTASRCA